MTVNNKARHRARRLALQGLYQWQFTQHPVADIEANLLVSSKDSEIDEAYFKELLHGVIHEVSEIDTTLQPAVNRSLAGLTPIELTVLRIAVYELLHRLDIPWRVVINEALELNKTFGTQEGYRFVNGVLDVLAHQLRSAEIG
ncbi:MAG: transcription antitermination factor NusB [Gammaproteobacteria bacterium]